MYLRKTPSFFISAALIVIAVVVVFFAAKQLSDKIVKADEGIKYITNQEMIEDFDQFWDFLYVQVPFIPASMEAKGIDVTALVAEQRSKITDDMTAFHFVSMMAKIEAETNGIAGLDRLKDLEFLNNSYEFKAYQTIDSQLEQVEIRGEKYYSMRDYIPDDRSSFLAANESLIKPNMELLTSSVRGGIIDDKTAYISFYPIFDNVYYGNKLFEFYKSIQNYDNLIIDIRNNGGGSTNGWETSVVEPLLNKDVEFTNYALVLNSETAAKRYADGGVTPIGEALSDLSELEILPEFAKSKELFGEADYFVLKSSKTYANSNSETRFSGKIWLLTNEGVMNEADLFVNFCKNTGFAEIVGEKSNGNGISAHPYEMDRIVFQLNNSALAFVFNPYVGINSDGSPNTVSGDLPDVLVEGDAYEECLKLIERK